MVDNVDEIEKTLHEFWCDTFHDLEKIALDSVSGSILIPANKIRAWRKLAETKYGELETKDHLKNVAVKIVAMIPKPVIAEKIVEMPIKEETAPKKRGRKPTVHTAEENEKTHP